MTSTRSVTAWSASTLGSSSTGGLAATRSGTCGRELTVLGTHPQTQGTVSGERRAPDSYGDPQGRSVTRIGFGRQLRHSQQDPAKNT